MTAENPRTLPLLSLRNLVLFPGAVMPVEIGRPSSLRLIDAMGGKGAHLLVGTQKDADIEKPAGADLYTICVEGEVVRIVKAAENRVTAVLRGLERRRVVGFPQEKPYLLAQFDPLTEIRKDAIEIVHRALTSAVDDQFVPGFEEIFRHGPAHESEPDEANRL